MHKRGTLTTMIGLVAALTAGAAALRAAEPGEQGGDRHRKVCLLVDSAEPVTFDLEELKDGESKTITSGDRQITATRKGDGIEVTTTDKDGARRVLIDTTIEKGGLLHSCLGDHGGKAHQVIVHASREGSGDIPCVVQTGTDGDEHVTVKKYVVRTPGDGSTDVKVDAELLGHECAVEGAEALATYRCKEDEAMLSLPKAREPQVAPTCPVCGKPMDKVKAHQIVVRTTVREGGEV